MDENAKLPHNTHMPVHPLQSTSHSFLDWWAYAQSILFLAVDITSAIDICREFVGHIGVTNLSSYHNVMDDKK